MKIKTEQDYVAELHDIFPDISEEELSHIVDVSTKVMVKYLRKSTSRAPVGVSIGARSALVDDKRVLFRITPFSSKRIFIKKRESLRRLKKYRENNLKSK